MSSSSGNIYRGRDVHAYTADMREIILKYRDLHIFEPMIKSDVDALVHAISLRFPSVAEVLEKMMKRSGMSAEKYILYTDSDLLGVNIWRLLQICWNLVLQSKQEDGLDNLLEMTLQDAGKTCIQGDSHRLLFMMSMLLESQSNQTLHSKK